MSRASGRATGATLGNSAAVLLLVALFLLPEGAVGPGVSDAPRVPIASMGGPASVPRSLVSPLPPHPPLLSLAAPSGVPLPPSSAGRDDWPTYLHDPVHSSANLNESSLSLASVPDLRQMWTFATNGTPSNRTVVTEPVVAGGTVYFGAWNGYEYALNASTGTVRWSTYLGQTYDVNCSPNYRGVTSAASVVGNTVYVGGGDGYWYALNAANGSLRWRLAISNTSAGFYNWGSSAILGTDAFVGLASNCDNPLVRGAVLEINLVSHLVARTFYVVPPGGKGGSIWSTPTVDPETNTLYVTTGNGMSPTLKLTDAIVQLNATTLNLTGGWQIPAAQQQLDGDFGAGATLAFDDHDAPIVVAANKNGVAYAWNASNVSLGPRWSDSIATSGGCPECGLGSISPGAYDGVRLYLAGGNVAVGTTNYSGSVDAVDPSTGAFLWRQFTPGPVIGALATSAGIVVAGTGTSLEVLDAANGSVLFDGALPGNAWSAPSIAEGCIFQGTTDGSVTAFGLPGRPCGPRAGPEWVPLPQSTAPSPRANSAMVYDGLLRGVYLFGGRGPGGALGDTWLFKDGNWSIVPTATAPSPRWGAGIAYDPAAGEVVLEGGTNGSARFNDTWTFNGTWTNVTPGLLVSPSARSGAAFGYDQVAAALVLFGGVGPSGALGDTWEFSNGVWIPMTPLPSPPARWNATLSRQLPNGSLYLFGGTNGTDGFNDLWQFTGTGWAPENPAGIPPVRENSTASIDGQVPEVVQFGGNGPSSEGRSVLGDTWNLNSSEWLPDAPSVSPAPRAGASEAFDARDHYLILFGGDRAPPGSAPAFTGDTWGYAPVIFGNASANRTRVDVNGSVGFSVGLAGGFGVVTPVWVFGDGGRANGRAEPTHAFTASGTFEVHVWGNDSVGQSLELNLTIVVAGPFNATLSVGPKAIDVGQTTFVNETAFGGSPPFTYSYYDLPPGCLSTSTPTLSCQPSGNGTFFVHANVTDSGGTTVSAPVAKLRVFPSPAIGYFRLNASRADAGVPVEFQINVTGGSAPFTVVYAGLPGCVAPGFGNWSCRPVQPGTGPVLYPLVATVTDALGERAVSGTVNLTVYPALRVALTVSPSRVVFNATLPPVVYWNASISGGDPPYLGAFRVVDLPTGCRNVNATNQSGQTLTCSPKIPGVFWGNYTATDALGIETQGSANLTVASKNLTPNPGPSAPPTKTGIFGGHLYEYLAVGALAALVVLELVLLVRQRRGRGPARRPRSDPDDDEDDG